MLTPKESIRDNKIMALLGLEEISHVVAHTNRGELTLTLRKGNSEKGYRFNLDSVPLEDEKNLELKELFA